MGIKGLAKLIADTAPGAVREKEIKAYFGRKVALDASMCMYQFLIAVRSNDGSGQLVNEHGDVTSHIQGMFWRTIRMMDNGIKPCYVFDGKPPDMKSGELKKRVDAKKKAEADLAAAKEEGDAEQIDKYAKRTVRVTREQNEEVKQLLRLMGIPVVEAPGEAEASCATLAKAGKVWAAATEDMDALQFGTPILLRHLTFSQARKIPVHEYSLDVVLHDLGLTMQQFIDMGILCGCDYTSSIRAVGPKTALKWIKEHKTIEGVIEFIKSDPKRRARHIVPDDFQFAESRHLFNEPDVVDPEQTTLTWGDPDEEALIQFLVHDRGFSLDRVKSGIDKLKKSKKKGSQKRLESFFGPVTVKRHQKKAPASSKQPKQKKRRTK